MRSCQNGGLIPNAKIISKQASHFLSASEAVLERSKWDISAATFSNPCKLISQLHFCSFALVEINLILAKMHFAYDLELRDVDLDWLRQSSMHVMWSKPAMHVRFHPARK